MVKQLLREIEWLKRQTLNSYKQYREYLHQIRQKEIDVAFKQKERTDDQD